MAKRDREEEATERQCAVTRARLPVEDLIRFVADPDGRIVPDLKRRLPGRGVSVACARDAVAAAVKRGVFARALKRPVTADPDLPLRVDELLARAALGALALANKAGEVVTGFAKVEESLAKGAAIRLVHAVEAAEDGRRKLEGKARARGTGLPAVDAFTAEQLSLALGRPNVIHAAVTGGGASAGFLAAAARLTGYRAGGGANAAA